MTDTGPRASGWYADPAGRFQYRYWDGDRWTDRAASEGVEHHDPPVAGPRPVRRGPAGPPARRWPVVLALVVLVAALVGTSIFVLGPKRHHSQKAAATSTTRSATTTTLPPVLPGAVVAPGSGLFSEYVDRGTFQVRPIHLLAGQTAVIGWHTRTGQADVRIGIASATVDQLADRQYVGTAQRTTAVQDAESFLVALPGLAGSVGSLTVNDPTIAVGPFTGVVLGPPDTLVAPVEGDYAVLVAGLADKTAVDFNIAVRGEPTVTGNLRADDYNKLVLGPFRDAVNRFVLGYCNANPALDRGACDRFQTDNDGWPGTGADTAPATSDTGTSGTSGASGGSGASGRTTTTQRRTSSSTTSTTTGP